MQQKLGILFGKNIANLIHHFFFSLLILLCFASVADAAGYNCPTYRKYTSCNSGYYLSDCGTFFNGQTITDPSAGNSCKTCPTGSGTTSYSCPGGNKCPSRAVIAVKRIYYNLNGGSGSIPVFSTCMTNPCTLNSGNTNDFYRAGYQLVGWSTDPDAEDGSFSITVSGMSTTVYAVWKQCTGATYKDSTANASAACSACPTATSGWTRGTGTGWDSYSDCYQYRNATSISRYCSSGQLRRYASSASAWSSTATESVPFRADPGAYVSGSGINMTCARCSGSVYSPGGDVHSCTACPTADSGWTRGTGTGWDSYSDCYEYRNATSISSYCSSGQLRRYASSASAWSSTASEYTAFRAEAGAYVSGSGINMTCARCSGSVYSPGGDVHSCTACPTTTASGWNRGTGTGWDSEGDCYFYRRATSISNYCSAGELRVYNGDVPDGTTPSAAIVTEYEAFEAKPGSIVTGSGTINMTCAECGEGEYSAGGDVHACTACPELTPGFEYDTRTGMSSYTQCVQGTTDPSVANSNCMADPDASQVAVIQIAGSATSWDGSVLAVGVAAKPGAILDSNFQDGGLYVEGRYPLIALCTQCGAGTYSAGGDVKECTACPALTPGFDYTASAGASSYTECAQYTNDPSVANPNCMADDTADSVVILQTASSPTSWNGGVIAVGVVAKPGAILDSQFQNGTLYVEDRYPLRALCRQCGAGKYSPGGDVKECTACLDNYTTTGDALTDHDSASDCKIYCDGGSYISVANATQCSNVGAGYWAPSSTIPQGSVGSRTACESGLTTIGFGAGADEAGDCGRVLNVGDEKIYLRSTKKTTPSLNISINGDVFYGNMSTATKGSLRINSGGTTYSVYDDSM